MRLVMITLALIAMAGCEKEIHEAHSPLHGQHTILAVR